VTEIVLLLIGTAVLAALSIRVGMLLAPKFERFGVHQEPERTINEAPSNDDDNH
jgi:hypothetical protein